MSSELDRVKALLAEREQNYKALAIDWNELVAKWNSLNIECRALNLSHRALRTAYAQQRQQLLDTTEHRDRLVAVLDEAARRVRVVENRAIAAAQTAANQSNSSLSVPDNWGT